VRRLILLMAAMAAAVLVVGGVAYALSVQCGGEGDQDPDPIGCAGTAQDDTINGTEIGEVIDARGGDDTVHGRGGADGIQGRGGVDDLTGDEGDDGLFGEGRGDTLSGGGGSNQYHGGSGPDTIIANESSVPDEVEEIFAGTGNDVINALDGQPDVIDCGAGRDRFSIDSADDLALNCLDRIKADRLPAND